MNLKILTALCLSTLISCDANIGIAQEKTQNDTYDDVQEIPNDSALHEYSQEDTGDIEEPESLEDFVYRGPYEVMSETRVVSVTNCSNMNYSIYTPNGVLNPSVVVLGHGFARGPDTMVGWADHLASWGVEVLLPTLCHYNILLGVDHEMNGKNMVELAQHNLSNTNIYAGHSAGGLAAIIAASIDSNSLGVLGLDTTDTEGIPGVPDFIGQQYANTIQGVGFYIQGEPSSCNADNNGLDLFEMMNESYIVKVEDADHCDFEQPTDTVCEMSCENSNATVPDDEIRSVITILGTSAILSLANISEDAWVIWGL